MAQLSPMLSCQETKATHPTPKWAACFSVGPSSSAGLNNYIIRLFWRLFVHKQTVTLNKLNWAKSTWLRWSLERKTQPHYLKVERLTRLVDSVGLGYNSATLGKDVNKSISITGLCGPSDEWRRRHLALEQGYPHFAGLASASLVLCSWHTWHCWSLNNNTYDLRERQRWGLCEGMNFVVYLNESGEKNDASGEGIMEHVGF